MNNIEYIYCCINAFGSNDTIYNYTEDLNSQEIECMNKLCALWIPGFNLFSFDENEGLVIGAAKTVDKTIVGNAYFKTENDSNDVYIIGYSAYRANVDAIGPEHFRGKKYTSHVLLTEKLEGYAVEMIDSSILKDNMLIEMDGYAEKYTTNEVKRLPKLENFKGDPFKFDHRFFDENKETIIGLLSNIVYAKENGEKLYINYGDKENYEKFVKIFKHAMEILPMSYANSIGFTINNGGSLINSKHFDIFALYSKNREILSSLERQTCYISLFDDEPIKSRDVGFEQFFIGSSKETDLRNFIISYISVRKDNDTLNNVEDFIRLVKITNVTLKEYTVDENNPNDSLIEVNNDLEFIKENADFIKEHGSSLHFDYLKIEEVVQIISNFSSVNFNGLETLFNNLLEIKDPSIYSLLFCVCSSSAYDYKLLKTLCSLEDPDVYSSIKDEWSDFFKVICKASESTKFIEAIPLFKKLLKDFDEEENRKGKQDVVNFIISNDDDGFNIILDYELNKENEQLNNKVANIIDFILATDTQNREDYILKTYSALVTLTAVASSFNALTELKRPTKITDENNVIIDALLNKFKEEVFSCGNDYDSVHKSILMYLSLLNDEQNQLYSDSKQTIENYLINNVINKIVPQEIRKISFEYISSKDGNAVFMFVLNLTSRSIGNSKYKEINTAMKERLQEFEDYSQKVSLERKYTAIRVESILRSLKRLEDSKIIRILNQFGDTYKNRGDSFSLELQDRKIEPVSTNPDFYAFVDEFVYILFGLSDSEDQFVQKAKITSERKLEFAKTVAYELNQVKKVDYATAATDISSAIIGAIVLAALFLVGSFGLSYILYNQFTKGSFVILLGFLTFITPVSTIIFYCINYKQRILHNAFVKTLWQSAIIFILVFGIAFLIFGL